MILCKWEDLKRYIPAVPGLEEAIDVVNAIPNHEKARYPLSNGNAAMVQVGPTRPVEGALVEAHRKFLDIHYTLEGVEYMGWAPIDTLTPEGDFNEEGDAGMYSGEVQFVKIPVGYCCVVFPEDGHMPKIHFDEPVEDLRKVCIKLKV